MSYEHQLKYYKPAPMVTAKDILVLMIRIADKLNEIEKQYVPSAPQSIKYPTEQFLLYSYNKNDKRGRITVETIKMK